MTAGLEIEGIVAGYDGKDILHGVTFDVRPGESLTIVGPNGSGKSTLLKTVVGLVKPRLGRIVFNGMEVTSLRVHERARLGLGYVPQEANVFRNLSVRENLLIGHEFGAKEGVVFGSRLAQVLELFPEIASRLKVLAGYLSGGQRQMLAMAAALMPGPSCLVLDEPSAGMSPQNADSLFESIAAAIGRDGATLLMIEQNVKKGLEAAASGLVLVDGRVKARGSSSSLLADRTLKRQFFGGAV